MKKILLNPGPSTTSNTVKKSLLVDDICHREEDFVAILRSIRTGLLNIVNANHSDYACILFSGSGTLSMEACITSLVPRNSKILFLNNGYYTERAITIAKMSNIDFEVLDFDPYESIVIDALLRDKLKDPEIYAVYTTHHETGTGILNNIESIGSLVKQNSKIFIVDTISSFAMIDIDLSKLPVDFIMSSSQKGIAAMPGLSFVIGKKEYLENPKGANRNYYANLLEEHRYSSINGEMRFTPPVQIVYSVAQAIREIQSETLTKKFIRHRAAMKYLRSRMSSLGFEELINEEFQSQLLVSYKYPAKNWGFDFVHDYCYERGVTIYPGKSGPEEYFRLSVFGSIDESDIQIALDIFENALEELNLQKKIS